MGVKDIARNFIETYKAVSESRLPTRILQRNELLIQQTQEIAAIKQRFDSVILGQTGVSWGDSTGEGNIKTYSTNSTVYAIVNAITNKMAIAPFSVYRIKDKKKHLQYKSFTGEGANQASIERAIMLKELAYEEDTVHPFNKLLERPNEWQNWTEFIITCGGFKKLSGNRYIYLNRLEEGADKGNVQEMWNMPPQFMKVVSDGTLFGIKEYRFTLGKEETIEPQYIIHSKYANYDFDINGGHLVGLSPLKAANRNITRSNAAVERSTSYLQNAGSPGALVNEEGGEDDLQGAERMRNDMNDRIRGKHNAGKLSLLNGKWSYLQFGMTSGDMQSLETEQWTFQQICNAFDVPPGLFDPSKSGEHNATEFKKQLITGAVVPELSDMRDVLNVIAAGYKDKNIYIDYDLSVYPELQEDLEKTVRILKEADWLKQNEKRIRMGADEDTEHPLMNEYLIASNKVTLGSLAETGLEDLDNETDA